VASAAERTISHEQRTLIEHLLRERISLRGISKGQNIRNWLFTRGSCAERENVC
jgi:hypothetical protein